MELVKDFKVGTVISAQLLVTGVSKGVNANHTPYLSVELRDASGSIQGKRWNATSEDEALFVVGNVLLVQGDVLAYKDNPQIHINEAKKLSSEEIDTTRFVAMPPISKEKLTEEFNNYVKSIKNEQCRALIDYFVRKFDSSFFIFPAAASIHHEYSSGLLMHEVTMAKLADAVSNIYPDVNRDILLTGVFLHDIGKLIELEGPVVFHYSLKGKLLGHISIMASLIQEAGKELSISEELTTVLTHMILSHHGALEYGSPVLPLTKEALLLSLIDNLDSKVTCLSKALDTVEKGEFTQKIFSLDNRCFYKPKL